MSYFKIVNYFKFHNKKVLNKGDIINLKADHIILIDISYNIYPIRLKLFNNSYKINLSDNYKE